MALPPPATPSQAVKRSKPSRSRSEPKPPPQDVEAARSPRKQAKSGARAAVADASAEIDLRALPAVRRLIQRGRRRGYLSIEDVTAAIGAEKLSTRRLDELLAILREREITVARSSAQPTAAVSREGTNEEEHSTDPVRVYLREMGQVSLLTREGEVRIAKRIEAGTHEQQFAVLGTAYGMYELLRLADIVRKNKVGLRKVLDGLDDENGPSPEVRRKQYLLGMSTHGSDPRGQKEAARRSRPAKHRRLRQPSDRQ